MKGKRLLAAFLLGVGLCFVPAVAHCDVQHQDVEEFRTKRMYETKANFMDFYLLEAKVRYIMHSPGSFLNVWLTHDRAGDFYEMEKKSGWARRYRFLKGIATKNKVIMLIRDNRGVFSNKSETALLAVFSKHLLALRYHIRALFPDDADIVVGFYSEENVLLGYFYQGEYHLWER